mgnify:CR=1 FL=1|jgi:hypothetical protein
MTKENYKDKMMKLMPREWKEPYNTDAAFDGAFKKYANKVKSEDETLNLNKMFALLQECIEKRICSWCGIKVVLKGMNEMEKANFYRAGFCKPCTLKVLQEDKEFYVGKTYSAN